VKDRRHDVVGPVDPLDLAAQPMPAGDLERRPPEHGLRLSQLAHAGRLHGVTSRACV
jgi:hypothetical protein